MSAAAAHPPRRLSLPALVGVIFFIVCGGTYGIEEAVQQVGPWWTLMLVLVVPFLWAVPISLMVAELASLMPEDGGYYAWIHRTFGPFWAVQAGWWGLCGAVVDMALYPKLFVHYLSYLAPSLPLRTELAEWLVAAALIGIALVLNLRGARAVGRTAVVGLLVVIGPLAVFSALVLSGPDAWRNAAAIIAAPPAGITFASLAAGLSIVMWNYMGWDSASTLAGEVRAPQWAYPWALGLVALTTVLVYLLPLVAGLSFAADPAAWRDWKIWPTLGEQAGGAWLGVAIAAGGLVAQWSLFNSNLLYSSRLPYAMALRGALPAGLARSAGPGSAPAAALCLLAAIAACLATLSFEKLVVIDVLLYSGVLAMQFGVLIRLRRREPERQRPFRIPGGWPAIAGITLAPAVCAALLIWGTLAEDNAGEGIQLAAVAAVVTSGLGLYLLRRGKVR